ncbi:23S rRNA (guanosine(2251)-2'-O)-methyltransferase RlmB [Taibaiella sp. KBW10]|uniref:23S rRNA (guanosine(2251)-2'-O)-methyltransferase RlmB n=1 Tax=Taibaiella sp. KBW10 TaxID=2153357 RepID=UPI000F5B7097|nr:23S rRNA (guanosine(2251)-2'-O)-methyltransferase RlmB [Taibaiella sp. KBW10]RQO30729.1 23S rRNA (guanosine(2251)-2'-O)-methyltransferase RlmB [Taibaiella sp. KBW10]
MSFTNRPQNSNYRNQRTSVPKSRLIVGRKPIIEALNEAVDIEKIFILKTATGDELGVIKNLARKQDITVSYVPTEKLDRFTQANHQGVVAIAGLISYQPLQGVIDLAVDKGETPLFVILDGITDTRNLGAIARSAYGFGAHALVIPSSNNAAITEEGIKTSAGALEKIAICRVASVQQAVDTLKLNGVQIVATTLQTETALADVDLKEPIAIVMGAEDTGVSSYVLKTADHLVKIPMSEHFDSLNVSVAAGIMMYEIFKQRV